MSIDAGKEIIDVVVVGQTPPPSHGQAIMIERMLAGSYQRLRLHHVPMMFSRRIDEVGRPTLAKVAQLPGLIRRVLAAKRRTGARVLYYPPSPAKRTPLYRDLALLLAVRWAFDKTIFHFHAAGLTEIEGELSSPLRALYRRAFGRPSLAIALSKNCPPDGQRLGAERVVVVPNGIPDRTTLGLRGLPRHSRHPARILSLGMVSREKGVDQLLEACGKLHARGVAFELQIVGSFASEQDEGVLRQMVCDLALGDVVHFVGPKHGDEKWREYQDADLFCFPSRYSLESFGVVMVEAMQFALPVVATRWRAAQEVVTEGESGLLVRPRDGDDLARALEALLLDESLRQKMGARGRELYLERYTEARWWGSLEEAIVQVVEDKALS